jgi:hypothetical protein
VNVNGEMMAARLPRWNFWKPSRSFKEAMWLLEQHLYEKPKKWTETEVWC